MMNLKPTIKQVVTVILFVLCAALTFQTIKTVTSFYVESEDKEVLEEEQEKITIGFSLGTLKEERWIKDRDILMAKVKELGADILVQNANNDDQDQIKQVRYLLDQNIDVLILVPNDLNKAATAVELARREGVKVISYDRLVLNSNIDLYVSFDNARVGELMAEYILKEVPEGNILIVNGPTSDHNTKLIKEGYDQVLKEVVEDRSINIIGEKWAPNWMKEYAFQIMDELLQDKSHIDAVIAGNDGLADGIIQALSQHRLAGEIVVVGQDADLAATQRVVEGTQLMTVYKPIEKLADATARMAIQLAKGEELSNIKNSIYNGMYDVPYYILEPIAVDITNLDETIIKDGFHRIDEIYRNLSLEKNDNTN
ncbi:MAG: substrate-binding domain-containing protein [Clostridiaceae bacterium]|nr:substrate-binding domain-containing protein [Clostridiaceae bacterium]